MKIDRAASIPLIVHDPYLSIWSGTDRLYDADTLHWSGAKQALRGYVTVGDRVYCFMGDPEFHQVIEQVSVDVTATGTEYVFENAELRLAVRFTSPLLLSDPVLVSRPCCYIDFSVVRKTAMDVTVELYAASGLVQRTQDDLIGSAHETESFHYAMMGRACQQPLNHSGDHITIDWGFLYLAGGSGQCRIRYDADNRRLHGTLMLGESDSSGTMILAYDDLLSIYYFGQWRKAYWTNVYDTILDAIHAAFEDKKEVTEKCAAMERDLEARARAAGGEDYVFLCTMSYRHTIAAHKLIEDEQGNLIFLSKENDSNGCIGTVDLSYPSAPLFLLYDTEYVKGMLRPVFRFAQCPVWEYDFAPHDVGRYPYAAGQVYGLDNKKESVEFSGENGAVFPFYHMYPKGSGVYDQKYQMPVEESGNMLILTAAICLMDADPGFARPYYPILRQWTEYLLAYGADPGEQLCTDDFAGHLSHNVNLSAKAVMGIEAFSILAGMLGNKEDSEGYHAKAVNMAENWQKNALAGDHYMLAFGSPDSWSLKYNLVWDRLFHSGLFHEDVFQKETQHYLHKMNRYGVPLDSRRDYTKSDWILWCAAMAPDRESACRLIKPIAEYLRETKTRVPFSDWYETVSGEYCHFIARSVQGGIFMPILREKM